MLLFVLWGFSSTGKAQAQEDFIYATRGDSIAITGYTGPGGTVAIPATLAGKPVTAVEGFAFSGATNLASVAIPGSVTSVWPYAFLGCTGLRAFNVDTLNPVYSSLDGVLFDKSQQALLQFPAGRSGNYAVPNSVVTIGSRAFADCTDLANLTIPNSVTNIEGAAFSGCTGLTNMAIPSGITNIGHMCFYGCTGLAQVTIPTSVAGIASYAFSGCSRLESVVISNGVRVIEESTFGYCAGLTHVILPESVTRIAETAFISCTGLAGITIPSGVTAIGPAAFSKCTGLVDITFPDSLTTLGDNAFGGCTRLATVVIPDNLTNLGLETFSSCASLTSINVEASNPAFSSLDGVLCDKSQQTLLQYPAGRNGNYVVPSGVKSIASYAFSDCAGLSNVIFPDSVTSLGNRVFFICTNLAGVYFEGNAPPPTWDWSVFEGVVGVTVYYRAGTTGWGSIYEGRPTALWIPMPSYEEWAQTSGLLNRYPNAGGKQDDPDGDGLTNLEEMLAGTDPTRRESVLAFQSGPRLDDLVEAEREPVASTQLALYFQSVPGKVYQIQGANELGGEWHTVATAAASTTQKRVVWNKTDPHFFFRILVLPPP